MRIKASQMERMFHLSANGIKLYEKHGIIRPARGEGSSYRLYGQDEMQAMGCALQCRRYGFSMQETAKLLGGMDEAQQLEALDRREQVLEREIDDLFRIRKSLRINAARARQAASLMDRCIVEEKPAMYFLASQRGDQLIDTDSDAKIGEWISRYAPHLSAAVLMDGPYFVDAQYSKDPLLGVAVDAHVAIELGLCQNEHVTYLPPKPCVVTAVRMTCEHDMSGAIARVRAYAQEQGIALYAGGLMRLVQCVREGERMIITGLIWAPLKTQEGIFGEMR